LLASANGAVIEDQRLFVQESLHAPRESFQHWISSFEKVYRSIEEYERRFEIWLDNLKFVHDYNAHHTSHWLGMTPFADLSHDEWKQRAFGYRADLKAQRLRDTPASPHFRYEDTSPPKDMDWRATGAVAEVKNQQMCGAC